MINKKFNKIVRTLRNYSNKISKEFDVQVWCVLQVAFPSEGKKWLIFDLNPYRINLRTYNYGTEIELMTGKTIFVPNLTKCSLFQKLMD